MRAHTPTYFEDVLAKYLPNIKTWGDLAKVQAANGKQFSCVSYWIKGGIKVRFPDVYTEHLGFTSEEAAARPISEALKASAAIFFGFVPPVIKNTAGHEFHFLDGGRVEHYPIAEAIALGGALRPTIGVCVDHPRSETPYPKAGLRGTKQLVIGVLSVEGDAVSAAMRSIPSVANNTIVVDALGIGKSDFSINPEQIQALWASGDAAATAWMATQVVQSGPDTVL